MRRSLVRDHAQTWCRAGAWSVAPLPLRQLFFIHRRKKVRTWAELVALQHAQLELTLRDCDEADDWFVAFRDHDLFAVRAASISLESCVFAM